MGTLLSTVGEEAARGLELPDCCVRPPFHEAVVARVAAIHSADDAVALLVWLARDAPSTDAVHEALAEALDAHYHRLRCADVQRLSRLHRLHAADHDERAYALTTVWACVVAASHDRFLFA